MERSRTRERTSGRSQKNLVLGGAASQKNLLPAVDADASKQKEEKKDGDYGEAYTGVSFVDIESMLLNLALIAALLGSIMLSLVLTMETDELNNNDKYYLASRHYVFREVMSERYGLEYKLMPCHGEMPEGFMDDKTMADSYPTFYPDVMAGLCKDENMEASRQIFLAVTVGDNCFMELGKLVGLQLLLYHPTKQPVYALIRIFSLCVFW